MKPPSIQLGFSVACADFKNLGFVLRRLTESGCNFLHFDVVDGHFARTILLGPTIIASLRDATPLPFETHLAVCEPDLYLEEVAASGNQLVTAQIEACPNAFRFVRNARQLGMKVGFALNPATPIVVVENLLEELDIVQLMTVDAGFSGQQFVPQVLPKIRQLRELACRRGLALDIGVDGNVNHQTIPEVVGAGANILVLGTSSKLMDDLDHLEQAIDTIRKLAEDSRIEV